MASMHAVTKQRYKNEPRLTLYNDPEPLRYNQERQNFASSSKEYDRIYTQDTMASHVRQQQWRYGESYAQENDRLSRDIYNRVCHNHANPLGRQGVVDHRDHLDPGTQTYLSQNMQAARPQSARYSRVHAPQFTGGLKYRAHNDSGRQMRMEQTRMMDSMQSDNHMSENFNRIYDPSMAPIDFNECREYEVAAPRETVHRETAPLAATVRRVAWQDQQAQPQAQYQARPQARPRAQPEARPQHQSYPHQIAEPYSQPGWQLPEGWTDSQPHNYSKWARAPSSLPSAGDIEGTSYYKQQTERMMTNPIR